MKLNNHLEFRGKDGEALERAIQKAGDRFGLFLTGKVGSGKTTAARELAARGGNGYMFIDCTNETHVGWLSGWHGWIGHYKNVVLDDFGRDVNVSDYGVLKKPVADFIRALHSAWKSHQWEGKLFITTNGTFEEIVRRFDESIGDRLREMCVGCKFDESRRPSAGVPRGSAASVPETPSASTLRPDDSYTWDDYVQHGINPESDAFKAALWASAQPSRLMDALRVLRVDLGLVTGEDCERIRACCHSVNSLTLSRYVRDVFVYGLCGGDQDRAAFCHAMVRYAQAVFDGSTVAQSAYNPKNAATFRDWWRRFDLPGLFDDYQRRNKVLHGCTLDHGVVDEFHRIHISQVLP